MSMSFWNNRHPDQWVFVFRIMGCAKNTFLVHWDIFQPTGASEWWAIGTMAWQLWREVSYTDFTLTIMWVTEGHLPLPVKWKEIQVGRKRCGTDMSCHSSGLLDCSLQHFKYCYIKYVYYHLAIPLHFELKWWHDAVKLGCHVLSLFKITSKVIHRALWKLHLEVEMVIYGVCPLSVQCNCNCFLKWHNYFYHCDVQIKILSHMTCQVGLCHIYKFCRAHLCFVIRTIDSIVMCKRA